MTCQYAQGLIPSITENINKTVPKGNMADKYLLFLAQGSL